jgi:hypothetical protein
MHVVCQQFRRLGTLQHLVSVDVGRMWGTSLQGLARVLIVRLSFEWKFMRLRAVFSGGRLSTALLEGVFPTFFVDARNGISTPVGTGTGGLLRRLPAALPVEKWPLESGDNSSSCRKKRPTFSSR